MSTVTATPTETAELRRQLTELTYRVGSLERHLGMDGATIRPEIDLATFLPAVKQITQELFPGKLELTQEYDPEYPEDRYTVVNVEATGDLKVIADRGRRWHQRIRELSAEMRGVLRLSIAPR